MQGVLKKSIKPIKKNTVFEKTIRFFMYVLLLDLAVVFLYPFFYMIITSLKSPEDLMDSSVVWVVNKLYFHNYELAYEKMQYIPILLKTVLYCVIATGGHIFACSFVGYGFARYNFTGKRAFSFLLILSMVVPIQTIIVPEYLLYSKMGVANGYFPMLVPTWLGYGLRGALFIFLFRQFYLSLPRSLEEAASVDGCTPVMTFFRIAFPASTSSVIVSIVLSVVWHWNDFYEPNIYIRKNSQMLLPMLLPKLYNSMKDTTDATQSILESTELYTEGVAMAATFLAVIPILIFYLFFQKQFRQGIETSGITGE